MNNKNSILIAKYLLEVIIYIFNVHLLYPCLHQYFDLKNGSDFSSQLLFF